MTGERVAEELEASRTRFHAVLDSLSPEDWDARSLNPAWTNGQLLYHMTFAFMLIPALYWMIRFWSRLPDRYSRWFAAVLNWSTPLFDWVNAIGPKGQEHVLGRRRIGWIYDRTHRSILRKVRALTDEEWSRGMHYPRRWDPTFGDFMTYEDLFRYPTKHFEHHLRHLSRGRDAV